MPATQIKRITPRIKNSAAELYALQRSIAKMRANLRVLEAAEASMIASIAPAFHPPGVNQQDTDLIVQGMHYTVKYRHVERDIIDADRVARVFAKLGKSVPKKHSVYTTLKVVKAKA